MKTIIEPRPNALRTGVLVRLPRPAFVVAGIAFFVGGVTHPSDSGHGNKVQQLHEMLVSSSWYPSHAFLLAAMVLFATAILALRRRRDFTSGMERLLRVVFVIA